MQKYCESIVNNVLKSNDLGIKIKITYYLKSKYITLMFGMFF
jgi:hypothetical protein